MRCRVRRLKGICLAPLVLLVTVAALSLSVDGAGAANTRVSISNFAWSNEPGIDLGESVTWDWIGPEARVALGVGLLGGFTTFSTFSVQAVLDFEAGLPLRAFAYIAASVLLSLGAAAVGYFGARSLFA